MTNPNEDPRAACHACERDDALEAHDNAAALNQVAYRVGRYGRFLARMQGWLSRQGVPPNDPTSTARPLAALTTRASDDPALALLDAWACTLDVLTFYQEYIANEGFLRTAKERRSVLELARSIGYELAPGVAASTRLAFTLLSTPKAPEEVTLQHGLQVQSVPGPGEQPQTFETVEEVLAKPVWNSMRPVQRTPHNLTRYTKELYIAGVSSGLRVGDQLLIVGKERLNDPNSDKWKLRTVTDLVVDKQAAVTRVGLDAALGNGRPRNPQVFAFSSRVRVFGHSAPDPSLFALETKSELQSELNTEQNEWAGLSVPESADSLAVHVVGEQPSILPQSWFVLQDAVQTQACLVGSVTLTGRTDFGLSLPTTRVELDTKNKLDQFSPRTASVLVVSRELTLDTKPLLAAVAGDELVLEQPLDLHEAGRSLIVSGPAVGGSSDEPLTEVALVQRARHAVRHGALRTVLKLATPLEGQFVRSATTVFGNVARATHGKTVTQEVLGSGDGSKRFQSFMLRQNPLTMVSTSSGIESTLTIRVGGVAWTPATSTFGQGPDDRVYVPRVDDDGKTTITFGDGHHGARLPTGSENITASYRSGIGKAGAVAAGKLTILKTRPQGVKAVHNPIAALGSADPEVLADARGNAPVTVLTLDRLVSVSDYEDYARSYPGIGKAQSTRLWDGRRWWVHLTVATSEGAPLTASDDLYLSLTTDIAARRDPLQRVMFDTFVERTFRFRASLKVDDAYIYEDVVDAIALLLRQAFSFEDRGFGQAVTAAELVALVHDVEGVLAIDLDALWYSDEAEPPTLLPVLPARGASWDAGAVRRADLLLLDDAEDAVELQEMNA